METPDDRREPTPARPQPVPPEETINEGSEVDEASLESFPASDAPAWTGSQSGPPPDASERAGGGGGKEPARG